MRVSIILDTRPEIIKSSPIIREYERLDLDYFILHNGQHYDKSFGDGKAGEKIIHILRDKIE
jgi:UDP-N-acetylglucosamine 2-epimerase